jgi:hypothetical protein
VGGVSTSHLRRRGGPRQSRLGRLRALVLWAGLLVVGTAAADEPFRINPPPMDRITVQPRGNVQELSWSDMEERLQGSIQPDKPIEGQPLKILLNVGSFEGAAFAGPITVTLREAGSTHGQTQTVKKGEVNWHAEFIPERAGAYQLDVSFRTTHLKVLHADISVATSPVPRFVLWAMVGLAAMVALGYGLRSVLRKDKPAEPTPEASPPAPSQPEASVPAEPEAPQKPSTL